MFRAMLDTNIVSELMREPRGHVRQRLDAFGADDVCMSIIAAGELRFSVEKSQSAKVLRQYEQVVAAIPVLGFEAPAHECYGRLRAGLLSAGRPIGPNDLFIAAHALALNLTLITANAREFSRVPGLAVENWLD